MDYNYCYICVVDDGKSGAHFPHEPSTKRPDTCYIFELSSYIISLPSNAEESVFLFKVVVVSFGRLMPKRQIIDERYNIQKLTKNVNRIFVMKCVACVNPNTPPALQVPTPGDQL